MAQPLSDSIDELTLAKYCRDNNTAAQKILFTKYVDGMMLLCLRYITDREDARETMMDGFLMCFKNIKDFNFLGEGSLKAWLKKIMINQCLMQLRKRRLFIVAHDETANIDYQDYGENVLEHINAKEIIALIQNLPDGCRTIFNLYVFENRNHKEIGELLDISENTSKSQLHRARTLLKERIYKPAKTLL